MRPSSPSSALHPPLNPLRSPLHSPSHCPPKNAEASILSVKRRKVAQTQCGGTSHRNDQHAIMNTPKAGATLRKSIHSFGSHIPRSSCKVMRTDSPTRSEKTQRTDQPRSCKLHLNGGSSHNENHTENVSCEARLKRDWYSLTRRGTSPGSLRGRVVGGHNLS